MRPTSHAFKANVERAVRDEPLRQAMQLLETGFSGARRQAIEGLPEFDALCDQAREIKDHTLANLDFYLERFEQNVVAAGGKVHWCETPEQARQVVLAICQRLDARTVTKGKSMIAEEIGLNPFLEVNGIEPVETDLGEYIIQLADEPPSHIIGPAVHKTKDQVSDLFHDHHRKYGRTERLEDPQALVTEAREILRRKFFDADVGITGANFLIAETGSTVIVTNEGNGDLTQTLPRAHVVVASLEKTVPTLEDAATLLRVLARSATGQEMSVYTTFSTGPRRADDQDGPEEFHVVLLDNGRSAMLGTPTEDLLRCIRCGACMNHCPVYQTIGGHAYGWVYPGPIGAALDPHFLGIEETRHLPNASTFCGRCEEVCPMRIPLPKIMRHWREKAFESKVGPPPERYAVQLWAWLAKRPFLYRTVTSTAAWVLRRWAGKSGRIRRLPLAGGWTASRDLPAPEGRTFQALWAKRGGAK